MFEGKTVLITGGTGSFGRRAVDSMLEKWRPRRLIVFSRDELKQSEMMQRHPAAIGSCMRYFIGDVRDYDRLNEAFRGVDYIIHAAAMKQVPSCEYNPFETIKTNVLGAQNIIRAAIGNGVKKVMALSTDKAANPINLYGASKLCSDKLFIAGNSMRGGEGTSFSVVRYGNVVASRGSVIPFFLKCRKSGVLPVTDPRMTRFSITLDEAVDFVFTSMRRMEGGELFVPKIPSYRILDLAKAIAPEARIDIVGIRPGEKLHELMIPEDEARHTLEFNDRFLIQPDFPWWNADNHKLHPGGKPCPDGFSYRSDNNTAWLGVEELRALAAKAQEDNPELA